MGTTSEKLTYLNNTKQLLKDKINNLGGDITDQTTFRQYANQLQNVYDNLPKTEYQEGTEITLSNTLKGKLDFEKIYQQVEYIESTGSAYIDTGIIPNTNTKIDIQFETIQRGNFGIIFGGEETYKDNSFHLYNSSGVFDIGFGSMATAFRTSIDYNSSVKYTLIMDKNGFNINGNTGTFPEPTISTTYSIYLFAVHRATNVTETNAQKRIYYCKLYDNGTLVRDMIPCYRKSDGVIGMYDKVQDKFYTNIGTSTFTKGADIGDGFGGERVGIGDTSQKSYSGKNLFPNGSTPLTSGGITFTPQADGGIKVKGTSTYANYYTAGADTTYVEVANLSNIAEAVTLSVSGMQRGIEVYVVGQTLGAKGIGNIDNNINFTTILNDNYRLIVRVLGNNEVDTTLYIQLEKGNSATSFEKYVGGTASPNPSYPQDIEVVRGKNRLDDSSLVLFNSNKYISTSNFSTEGKIEIKPSTTYTLIYKANTINDMGMWEFDSSNNKTAISYTPKGRDNYSIRVFTTLSTTKTMSFYAGSNDTYTSVEEFLQAKELVILEGDYSSQAIPSYLPYNTLEVKIQNKNLCTEMEQGDVSTSTGEASPYQPTTSGFIRSKDYIPVKPSEVITVSYKNTATSSNQIVIFEYNANKTYIGFYYSNASTYTRTLGNETAYIKIRLQDTTNTLSNNTEIQVEYGNAKTSYVEHQEQIKQLSLGEYEFAKIGNYVDTIEYDVENDKVYKNEYISKVILNGSETIGLNAGVFYLSDITNYAISNNIPYCTHFKGIVNVISGTTSTMANNEIAFRNNIDAYRLYIRIDSISEGNALKTWLSTNKPMLYYALATPTKTEITGTLATQVKALYYSHSFTGTTIITSNGNLPMIIKVRGLKGE